MAGRPLTTGRKLAEFGNRVRALMADLQREYPVVFERESPDDDESPAAAIHEAFGSLIDAEDQLGSAVGRLFDRAVANAPERRAEFAEAFFGCSDRGNMA